MTKFFDFKTARRYFHFVAFKFENKYSLSTYWKDCNVQAKGGSHLYFENDLFRIEQQTIKSDIPYYNGDKDYSENEDGQPPFLYDLIAVYNKSQNLLLVGYPFKLLAKAIIGKLLNEKKYLSKGAFLKPNLNKLIKQTNSNEFSEPDFNSHFLSLAMTLTGDKFMTSIDLGGDRPLESPIYKSLFKDVIQKKEALIESCSLKFDIDSSEESLVPKTRGNVHLDQFGNLRTYIHGSGKNVFVLYYVLVLLKKYKCDETTLINPLLNLKDD